MPLHAALQTSSRPVLGLAAACLLLPAGLAGCYSYNTEVHNASSQNVQISILKGTRQRAIGSAVLAPGGSVGWRGATNGPVVARVTAEGVVQDVKLPRRALTEIDVWGADVTVTVAGTEHATTHDDPGTTEWEADDADASWEAPAAEEAAPQADADQTADEAADETDMIDLIESDD